MDEIENDRPIWFVGAQWDGEDQMTRFIAEGIWANGYHDKYQSEVKAMRPGDRIVIKSSYTRKHGLPFEGNGHFASVMAIKATGTITENLGDGRTVHVDWKPVKEYREWYFYTSQKTVWKIQADKWTSKGLVDFTFNEVPQEYDRFRNAPYWRERFGDQAKETLFPWTTFYEEFAEKLLEFKDDRSPLIAGIKELGTRNDKLSYLTDQFDDDSSGLMRDICPFTFMGIFNRSITSENRTVLAQELGKIIGVELDAPTSFESIPVLNNQKSWFFGWQKLRKPDDIDHLWDVFAAARHFTQSDDPYARLVFINAFDSALNVKQTAWNLTTGLFWSNPWDFATLDGQSRAYISDKLGMPVPRNTKKFPYDGDNYLKLIDALSQRFEEDDYPVHNFPELSYRAYEASAEDPAFVEDPEDPAGDLIDQSEDEGAITAPPPDPYSIKDLMQDGCFLPEAQVARILGRLREKKNLILQGPPGTGKTWLAKRLAYALMGEKASSRVRAVQFHPNLSYEDFVRGWRPTGEGKLTLSEGVFMEVVHAAIASPQEKFVIVIEEINRGNPAQIFGELLTIIEAGKRTPEAALELCYPDSDGKRRPVHVPENLYLIGTMNIADRSLALVDLALRRRFAFVTLEPQLGNAWRDWVVENGGVDSALVDDIKARMQALNADISNTFGRQFKIGHSYVTPVRTLESGGTRDWFRDVAETEIGPLLEEYWFDQPSQAEDALKRLLQGW